MQYSVIQTKNLVILFSGHTYMDISLPFCRRCYPKFPEMHMTNSRIMLNLDNQPSLSKWSLGSIHHDPNVLPQQKLSWNVLYRSECLQSLLQLVKYSSFQLYFHLREEKDRSVFGSQKLLPQAHCRYGTPSSFVLNLSGRSTQDVAGELGIDGLTKRDRSRPCRKRRRTRWHLMLRRNTMSNELTLRFIFIV